MTEPKAFIAGCAGTSLSDDEKRFFARTQPWGLILFRRNIGTPGEVSRLTADFRAVVGRDDAPVLVDQEGGRVQRLTAPHWPVYPAAAAFEKIGRPEQRLEAATLAARLIAADLIAVGITVDCAPVLDVPAAGSHQVIGNRAFADDPERVADLAQAFAKGLLEGGVLPIIKHIPGHGRAGVDSHLDLPIVDASLAELDAMDFVPFRRMADLPAAMTAHVVYTALDPSRPATLSPVVIETIIRGRIGFDGLLLSDDLSMEALKGTLAERAAGAAHAGCDMLLHCNGKLDEAEAVAAAAPPLRGRSAERARQALAYVTKAAMESDGGDLRPRFDALMASAA